MAQYQSDGTVHVFPSFFADDDFGRSNLLYHEFGHEVSQRAFAEDNTVTVEVLRPFRLQPDDPWKYHNFAGLSTRPEEMLADVYAELMMSKRQPWEESTGNYAKVYKHVLGVAARVGLPLPVWSRRQTREFNRCHNPEGPGGGQFCSTPGRGTPAIEWREDGRVGHVQLSKSESYDVYFREELPRMLKYNQPLADATVTKGEVDLAVEQRAVKAAFDAAHAFWTSTDPDARAIKRYDKDPTEPLRAETPLHAMVVMTLSIADYGAGSGGPGGAKVFWGPYSAPNRRDRLKTDKDREPGARYDHSYADSLGVDPVYVLSHELHHAWGSGSELDFGSEVVALDAHLKLGLTEAAAVRAVRTSLSGFVANLAYRRTASEQNRFGRALRYLYKRNGGVLKEFMLAQEIVTPGEWERMVGRITSIGKRRPKPVPAPVQEARSVDGWPVVPRLGVVKCRNTRRKGKKL